MSVPTDAELLPLIEAMGAGDQAALLRFVEMVGPWIYSLQLRITGTTVAAAVLVEESLGRLWSDAPLYDRHFGRPMAWVMAVARAEGMAWADRRRGKEARRRSQPDAHAVLDPASPGAEPQIVAAVASLSGEHQAALRTAFFEGVPGGSTGADARARLADALPALAAALKEG